MHSHKNDINNYLDFLFLYLHQRFAEVTREEFEMLKPYFVLRRFTKKTIILDEGEVEDHLSIVVEGLVRKYAKAGKNEVTIQLATEGHIIQSEISFHDRSPSRVILETIEPSILISMSYDHVQEALEKIPRAEALGRAIVTQMFVKKDNRYLVQLKKTTREKFLDYVTNHPHMLQRVPQKILASYLNIKPETFSRLKHLIRRK
jgi:CRP-like cAMP-binding protein